MTLPEEGAERRAAPIIVIGGSLPGLAVAARLAKAGHGVLLIDAGERLGGRWAPVTPNGHPNDTLPPFFTFPAPWRDLLRKSGRPFEAELARRNLALVPAPPPVHEFNGGDRLILPIDRGSQTTALSDAYGEPLALAWRDLLDSLDDVWQALRPLGLEAELQSKSQLTADVLDTLRPRTSVADLAKSIQHPGLADIIRETAWRAGSPPGKTPGWAATRLSLDRTFGRWMVTEDGRPVPASALVDVLIDRLRTRKVGILLETEVTKIRPGRVQTQAGALEASAIVSTVNPWTQAQLLGPSDRTLARATRFIRPALAPTVSTQVIDEPCDGAAEVHRHTKDGPIIEYRLPRPDGRTLLITHDHSRTVPDPSFGTTWSGHKTWFRLPPLRTAVPHVYAASPSSRGGSDPSFSLLSAALAAYAVHEDLTGENIRPTNRSRTAR